LLGLAGVALLIWVWWKSREHAPLPAVEPPAPAPTATTAGRAGGVFTNRPGASLPETNAARTSAPLRFALRTGSAPSGVSVPAFFDPVVLEAQVALARRLISPGSIDGVMGSQTRAALRAFQRKESLPPSGALDEATRARLALDAPLLREYTVTSDDVARLRPLAGTWLGKSQQDQLDYETILELVAEKGCAHPNLIRRLNPEVDWASICPGAIVRIPSVEYPPPSSQAAFVEIRLAERVLNVFDEKANLLAHFPCSIAQRVDKRPVGELHVAVIVPNPNYSFDPEIFPESAEARELGRKLILPPGPNNPVGTVWIGLDRPGYGIHGSPRPEEVGRTQSHGCFRLANWNAEYLLQLVRVGTPVFVMP
jgi:lipoprotein-anchoring transpeptidase ErfK/SrfK